MHTESSRRIWLAYAALALTVAVVIFTRYAA
jgi:hypothetical protein